jgi:hypothetical protein
VRLRIVDNAILILVAHVLCAFVSIIELRWSPWLTVGHGVAHLCTIAEEAIVADGIVWNVKNLVFLFIAAIHGA